MPLVLSTRKSFCGLLSCRAAIMCVGALGILLARAAPVGFSPSSLCLTVSSHAAHDRQCFDHEDAQWVVSPSAPPSAPPPVVSLQPVHAADPFVTFDTNGLHYNRPPPII
ncbi:MAG: hypothetical protein WCA16_16095 [Candidatus Sulfotelmatobacter sp.]